MNAPRFEVERIDVRSTRPFVEAVAALDRMVPAADLPGLARLVSSHADARTIEDAVQRMAGDLGFMSFARLEQGQLASLLGTPKKMIVFLLGNPVLANRMFERDPAVSVYAPLRVSIYEDIEGRSHLTYDRPSTLLGQFGDVEIRTIGKLLDEKLDALAKHIIG